MNISTAIEVIKCSGISAAEMKHLNKLVRNGTLLAANFEGIPNFADILDDFPVQSKCDYSSFCSFRTNSFGIYFSYEL
jgi:hypothetical protein